MKGEMFMSIYSKLLEKAKDGGNYYINLKTKSLRIGRKECIKDGEVIIDEDLVCNEDFHRFNILENDVLNQSWKNVVWHLYNIYRYSVPSKSYKGKSYFKGVDVEELSLEEMVCGVDRHLAQAMLEGYILLASLKGVVKWEDDDKWFWQYEDGSELIVLKEWVE